MLLPSSPHVFPEHASYLACVSISGDDNNFVTYMGARRFSTLARYSQFSNLNRNNGVFELIGRFHIPKSYLISFAISLFFFASGGGGRPHTCLFVVGCRGGNRYVGGVRGLLVYRVFGFLFCVFVSFLGLFRFIFLGFLDSWFLVS